MNLRLLILCFSLALSAAAQTVAPANDNFASAATLGANANGTNVSATAEPGEPAHAGRIATKSVWWTITPSITGPLQIETTGSTFDTVLAVYTGTAVNALTLVAANDDFGVASTQSRVTFNATAGTVYRVAVDGYAGASGLVLLSTSGAPPANDNFAAAASLGSVTTVTTTVNNAGATAEPDEPSHAGQPAEGSLWWTWTAPANSRVQVNATSSVDTLLAVYTGTAMNALTLVAENDDISSGIKQSQVTFNAISGVTYAIAIDTFNGLHGDVTLTLDVVGDPTPPANDAFASAAALPSAIAASVTGSNINASRQLDEPLHAGQPSEKTVWWTWTALAPGPVALDTLGSPFDTVLAVYTGTALNALTEIASNDDIGGGPRVSGLTFTAIAGTTYHIAVAGYESNEGSINLNLAQAPDAPGNDLFADRSNLGNASTANATGVNLGATAETNEPAHDGFVAGTRSVWWKWTCPADQFTTVSTAGSGYNTVLAVYKGTDIDQLDVVAFNNDEDSDAAPPILTSSVTFQAIAGTTYVIAVDGHEGAAGIITLALAPTPPPDNDHFADAELLSPTSDVLVSDNYSATAEPAEPAHASSPAANSVWWQWTAPEDGILVLSTEFSEADTRLALYTGSALNALTLVAANDDEPVNGHAWSLIRTRVHAGTTYRIALDGPEGLLFLSHTHTALTQDNDAFANRIDLGSSATASTTGTNLGASSEAGEPTHHGQPAAASVWWKWTAPATGWNLVSTTGSALNSRVAVYTGSSLNALTAVTNVPDGTALPTQVNFHTTAGTTYVIAVDGVADDQGAISLAISAGTPPTAPDNDNFIDRTVLTGSTPILMASGNNTYASSESGEPAHASQPAAHSVWYEWTAPFSGPVLLDGTAMAFAPRLSVYTGTAVNALTPIAESAALGDDLIEFTAIAGTVYHIAIDDAGTFASGGDIAFALGYQVPANDNFVDAEDLANVLPATGSGFTTQASAESGEPAHASVTASHSIWWTWTAPASGLITIETTGSTADTLLGVYTGSAVNALTLIASNDDADGARTSLVTFTATGGTIYRIAVDAFEGSVGAIALSVHSASAPVLPVNDNFANAIDLGPDQPLSLSGTNQNATAQVGEPAHAGNTATTSVWWKWTAPSSTTVSLDTFGSNEDTVLAVYTGTTVSTLTFIASDDDAGGGILQSALTFNAVGGTTYYFAVDGYDGAQGNITLNFAVAPPANDDFVNSISLGTSDTASVSGTNYGATNQTGEPTHATVTPTHSVWWTWTAPADMDVDLKILSGTPGQVLAVYAGSSLTTLTPVTNQIVSVTRVVFTATTDTVYQIAVASATAASTGDIALSLSQASQSEALLQSWRAAHFGGLTGNAGIAANDADPDGDGISNYDEFAFGLDPNQAGDSAAAQGSIAPESSDLRAIFHRRKDYQMAGITYLVEFSHDLSIWTPSLAVPEIISDEGITEKVAVPFPALPPGKSSTFFRIQVEPQAP